MSHKSQFHIAIGAAPIDEYDSPLDNIDHILRLGKTALLYADKVTICSPISQLLKAMNALSNFSQYEWIQLFEQSIPYFDLTPEAEENMPLLFQCAKYAYAQKHPNAEQLRARRQLLQLFNNSEMVEFKKDIIQLINSFHLDELQKLLGTRRVTLKTIGPRISNVQMVTECFRAQHQAKSSLPKTPAVNTEQLFFDYFDELKRVISNPRMYPLFDHFSGNIINIGANAGVVKLSESQVSRSKPIGLAADILQRLPSFEEASVDEILDIQKELAVPLIKFRAAMIEFAKDIKNAAWDKDFVYDADEVFRGKVEPIVAEIGEKVHTNKYLHELGHQMVTKAGGSGLLGSILAGVLSAYYCPEIVTAGVGIVALGGLMESTRKVWAQKKHDAENNQLFFYYKTQKILESNR